MSSFFKVLIFVFSFTACIAGAFRKTVDDHNSSLAQKLYEEAFKESFFGSLEKAIKYSRDAALIHHGNDAWKYDVNILFHKQKNNYFISFYNH